MFVEPFVLGLLPLVTKIMVLRLNVNLHDAFNATKMRPVPISKSLLEELGVDQECYLPLSAVVTKLVLLCSNRIPASFGKVKIPMLHLPSQAQHRFKQLSNRRQHQAQPQALHRALLQVQPQQVLLQVPLQVPHQVKGAIWYLWSQLLPLPMMMKIRHLHLVHLQVKVVVPEFDCIACRLSAQLSSCSSPWYGSLSSLRRWKELKYFPYNANIIVMWMGLITFLLAPAILSSLVFGTLKLFSGT